MVSDRFVVRGSRVVLEDGVRPAAVAVEGGRIAWVGPREAPAPGFAEVDAGDRVVSPGLVDAHVHVNEPGRAGWEGFRSATRAAAAGGVATIVDMPLNAIPPTTDAAGLAAKAAAAEGACAVDVAFWGGVVPGNAGALDALLDAGARGAKAFLAPSGVDEFPAVGEADLRAALPILAARGAPLLVHAEDAAALAARAPAAPPATAREWAAARPPEVEVAAIRLLVRLARETGAWIHVVHLAAADALADLEDARAEGLAITVETCPHYLAFDLGAIPADDARFKCAPPIRDAANRERLWEGLAGGVIDLVGSDHSPCPPAMKAGGFAACWGGIAGLGTLLAGLWTEASARGFGLADLARWTAAAPARLAGLEAVKGRIAPGLDADLVVWDPDAEFAVEGARLHHRWPATAWEGRVLRGAVERTWVRGALAFDRGAFAEPPGGRLLLAPRPAPALGAPA